MFIGSTIQLGNPNSADFPCQDLHRGAVLLGFAVDWLFDFARARIAGDVNVRAFLHAGRKFSDSTKAGDTMPVGVRLPLALGVFSGPLGGK